MSDFKTKIGKGGRIVIPAEYRQALNLQDGDEVILCLTTGEIRILTPEQAIQKAKDLVRPYIPLGRILSEELIAERHVEE